MRTGNLFLAGAMMLTLHLEMISKVASKISHILPSAVCFTILTTLYIVLTLLLTITDIHDIRLQHILEAPACPPGLPSLPSPFSNKTHSWRLIDFELAQKVNYSVRLLRQDYRSDLAGVYEDAMTTYPEDESSWTDWSEGSEAGYSSNEDHPAGH